MSQQPIQKYQVETDIPFKKNIIINGDFNISQRGTTFVAPVTSSYSLDRWIYGRIGTMVHTITQSTDVPTVAQAGRLFTKSIQLALTTPDTSIAAGDGSVIVQYIEGFNFLPLAQQPMVLSFWVKAGIVGVYCAAFTNNTDKSFVAEYTINTINTWEYKTITILASPAAGTWNYTNGRGLGVHFVLAEGTTFQTTPNAWQTGNFVATSNQVNGVNTGAGNFLLTGVQLESGSVVTPIDPRPIGEELALCQRYYEKSYDVATNPGTITFAGGSTGVAVSTAVLNWWVSFKVAKRVSPAITLYSPNNGTLNKVYEPSNGLNYSVVAAYVNEQSFSYLGGAGSPTATAVVADVGYIGHWTADAEL